MIIFKGMPNYNEPYAAYFNCFSARLAQHP
ncbi:hypothetical protein BOMU111920_16275 [Bordetella muralis]